MPRRPPPTALRLAEGPIPPRGKSKFTLPSVPRPIFHPPSVVPRGPVPRAREPSLASAGMSSVQTPTVASNIPSPASATQTPPSGKVMRGPWDHSQSISVPFDVESVLSPPKRAAVSPGGFRYVRTSFKMYCCCVAGIRHGRSPSGPFGDIMTSSSTPDIASLSLSSQPSQQRLHDTYDYDGNGSGNGRPQYHFQTSPAIPGQSQYNSPLGMSQSPLKNKPQWLENPSIFNDNRSLSPPNNSDLSSGGSPPLSNIGTPANNFSGGPGQPFEDEIIPTAIVIKNIPFNVKRETLLEIIASLSIPTPYAFNYHLDQSGSFRGLAFANFRQASDADAVVAALNGFDVQGRKLRVEYKKVLQAGEKERIEREKAIRRMRSMQLEKEQLGVHPGIQQPQYDDFGPIINPTFSPQRSFSAGAGTYQQQQYSPPNPPPMPIPQTYGIQTPPPPMMPSTPSSSNKLASNELDLNDPSTLEIYSRILLFKDDHMRDELAFSRTLTPKQRRVVHLIAQKLGVYHYSIGEGEERHAVVTRIDPEKRQQPTHHPGLTRTPSAYLTPTSSSSLSQTLRAKKSMPDMKTLHTQAPRLNTRSSNGNIREGYATIASPSRRSPGGFGALFGQSLGFGNTVPPVPSLPASVTGMVNNSDRLDRLDSPTSGVVRQPRGPGVTGFGTRRERVTIGENQSRGFEAQSHQPLEM
ncbi:hypothetical protein EW146_g4896 [Bondarzewia mesenterica]|uniref:RRM domain-containing protein n=1 Tax=Bondarzewia mesenterica TaxID=1095465 RepID=A0A4S4LT19_9AGAM|nr:hypothetical protein EW146_g4896 [Bondarzewia mesenterica]